MYKSKLQELCHQYAWTLPEYTTVKEGTDHNPRFTSTVTVKGISFESPKNQFRSSKEAQNVAAQIAFDHFTGPKSILVSPQKQPHITSSSSGSSTSNGKVESRPQKMNIFQQRQNNNGQLSQVNGTPLADVVGTSSKGMLHLYKNRLQQYAQKHNLILPLYSSELDGPPHSRRFRSKVTVDGKTYETQEFFCTLKEAEHAAAKVAFESLAQDDIQEDEGLYKTLLQEFAQKEGLLFPVYDTARSGPPHMPIFHSMVEVGGETFQGQEAKTKKQAEMNAAKVAYNALMKCRDSQTVFPDGNLKSILGIASSSSQLTISDAKQAIGANAVEDNGSYGMHTDLGVNKGGQVDELPKVLPISSESVAADCSEPVIDQKTKLIIKEERNLRKEEGDANAKRHRCSTPPSPAGFCLPDGQSAASTLLDHPTESIAGSADSVASAMTSTLAREKIFIMPRDANVELPYGASVLPCGDEKWVAAKLELNQNH